MFEFMKRQEGAHVVEKMSAVLGVSRSGYYGYRTRQPSLREQADNVYRNYIKQWFELSRETYGSERMQREFIKVGFNVSKRRIIRLMRGLQLVPKKRRFFRKTTVVDKKLPVAENKLAQQFIAAKPNEKWVSDITYVFTQEGWLYVAAILDLYSRKLIGLAMDNHLRAELVIRAFKQALLHRGTPGELLYHSDRGCQYTSHEFQALLNRYGITCSMSGTGNCYDNAAMESFFATLKTECVYFENFKTREEAKLKIFDYCEIFYNNQRTHSTLGYLSPKAIEELYFNSEKTVH